MKLLGQKHLGLTRREHRRDQGRRDDARDLLSPIYHWFTTGLETPDLTDAKALLDDLRE